MAYFAVPPKKTLLDELAIRYVNIQFQWTEEPNKDWMEEWKKGFEAFPLIDAIWVVPSWLNAPPEAKQIIKIDPGMAFGTGTHETTQLAAELLQSLSNFANYKASYSMMDVGTGSGILCILAHLLGAGELQGNDIDPVACEVAQANLRANDCPKTLIDTRSLIEINKKFDVVVANIIDGVLIQLREELLQSLNKNGFLILTGILVEREALFRENFFGPTDVSLKILTRAQKGEWVGYLLHAS